MNSADFMTRIEGYIRELTVTPREVLEYLKMLVMAIDFRSEYTVTHSAVVTVVSTMLGKYLGLDRATLDKLYIGAFMHDIGKISTPVNILEKPDKLSDEEMAVMRLHVTKTAEILDGVVSEDIRRIAARHHEKQDGSGYPDGLGGEQLTLPERIVVVADIFSALIGRRSYKDSFSTDRTLGIIGKMRDDGKLCPIVCDALFEHYEEILRETEKRSDPVTKIYQSIKREYAEIHKKLVADGKM